MSCQSRTLKLTVLGLFEITRYTLLSKSHGTLCHRGIGPGTSMASVLVPSFLMLLREASVLVPILDRGTESLRLGPSVH